MAPPGHGHLNATIYAWVDVERVQSRRSDLEISVSKLPTSVFCVIAAETSNVIFAPIPAKIYQPAVRTLFRCQRQEKKLPPSHSNSGPYAADKSRLQSDARLLRDTPGSSRPDVRWGEEIDSACSARVNGKFWDSRLAPATSTKAETLTCSEYDHGNWELTSTKQCMRCFLIGVVLDSCRRKLLPTEIRRPKNACKVRELAPPRQSIREYLSKCYLWFKI